MKYSNTKISKHFSNTAFDSQTNLQLLPIPKNPLNHRENPPSALMFSLKSGSFASGEHDHRFIGIAVFVN